MNKRLVKYKKRKYKEGLTNMLSSAMENDPQTAWKIINELKMIHYLQIRRKK